MWKIVGFLADYVSIRRLTGIMTPVAVKIVRLGAAVTLLSSFACGYR